MLSKFKKLCRLIFNQLVMLGRGSLHWLLKKLIKYINKYPGIGIFLKKHLLRFPKIQNYIYSLHRHHILKLSQTKMFASAKKDTSENIDWQKYSASTEEVYQQLMHLKKKQ